MCPQTYYCALPASALDGSPENACSGKYVAQRILNQGEAIIINSAGSEAEVPMSELKAMPIDASVAD